MAALLELEGIRRSYQSGEEIVDVLQDVSLTINAVNWSRLLALLARVSRH